MGHIYFGGSNRVNAYIEYITSWLGNINNIKKEVRLKIEEVIRQRKPNINISRDKKGAPIIKKDNLVGLLPQDLDRIFDIVLSDKLASSEFDSYIIPPIITHDRFLNRNPYEIEHEIMHLDISMRIIKNILEKGFPVQVGKGLYVFYTHDLEGAKIQGLFDNLYPSNTIKKLRELKFFGNRDYWNTLVFLVNVLEVLYNLRYHVEITNDVIVWKKQQMEGSLFIVPGKNFQKIYRLLGESKLNPTNTNLYYLLQLIVKLWNILKNDKKEKLIEKIADEFSYYLLIKQVLDSSSINNLVKTIVKVCSQQNGISIKNLNKHFIVKFMEEVSGYKLDEYFELGQELRSKIYSLVQEQKGVSLKEANEKQRREILEDAEKIIDRLAKDLRNEELPEYFAETFEKDIVWLKSRGLKISEKDNLSEKFAKLMYDLGTSDLSKFYLIKASIILGLLSPLKK